MRHYLSQSALQAFEKCPRKYYYQYIMIYYGESTFSAPLDFGLSIHSILEKAMNATKADRPEFVTNLIYDKVNEVSDDAKKDYEGRLMKLIKPLSRICTTFDVTDTELYISDKLFEPDELSLETIDMLMDVRERKGKEVEDGFEGVWFGGYIDAVVKNGEEEDVVDWKTGKFSRMWLGPYERQAQLYTQLMRLNGRKVKRTIIVYVERDGFEHVVDSSEAICESKYNSMKEAFRNILAKGQDIEKFEMINNPVECNNCYFDFICNR